MGEFDNKFIQRLTQPGSLYFVKSDKDGKSFCYAPKSLLEIIQKIGAENRSSKVFVRFSGHEYTYGEIWNRAQSVSNYLICSGARGERIALAIENSSSWIVAFVGIVLAGAVPVLLTGRRKNILEHCLDAVSCTSVIVDDFFHDSFSNSRLKNVYDIKIAQETKPDDLTLPIRVEKKEALDEALICFTSGSMRLPKAVSLSNRALGNSVLNMLFLGALAAQSIDWRPATPRAGYPLIVCPLGYIAGYSQILISAFLGNAITLHDKEQSISDAIQRYHPASIVGIGRKQISEILNIYNSENLSGIQSWHWGGEPADKISFEAISSCCPNALITTGYGMTETTGGISIAAGKTIIDNPTNLGTLSPVIDVDVRPLPRLDGSSHNWGMIWLRGPVLMTGYISGCTVTGKEEDWFCTGDVGYVNNKGELVIIAREKELVKVSDRYWTYSELEKLVADMTNANQVCVVRSPIDERSYLFVLDLSYNTEIQDLLPILSHHLKGLNVHLASGSVFPTTESGKINRAEVYETYWPQKIAERPQG